MLRREINTMCFYVEESEVCYVGGGGMKIGVFLY